MFKRKNCNEDVVSEPVSTKKIKILSLPVSPPPSTFPSDVLKWMKKNAKPKMALKLMQLCKYFQHQEFPYFVVKSLFGKQQFGWQYQALNRKKGVFGGPYQTIDLKSLDKKLWITEELSLLHWEDTLETILIDSVLPKLGVCDFQFLSLNFQNITFKQFKILTASGNVTVLSLRNALIRDKNGDNVPLEDILEILPKIQELILDSTVNSFFSHQNAAKKVPSSLKRFTLQESPEDYNFDACFKFIQNRQEIRFRFYCIYSWSTEITEKVQNLTNNFIDAFPLQCFPPNIHFHGQSKKSYKKLEKLTRNYQKKNSTTFCSFYGRTG